MTGSNVDASPYMAAYPWSSGFGTKYADPATLIGSRQNSAAFTSDSSTLFVTSSFTPFIHAYPFTTGAGGGFGTKYSNPSVLPSNVCRGVQVTTDDAAVVMADNGGVRCAAYAWTGSGFGAKFSNPSVLMTTSANDCSLVAVP